MSSNSIVRPATDPFSTMPYELTVKILALAESPQTARVCRHWNICTKDVVYYTHLWENFQASIAQNMSEQFRVRQILAKIKPRTKITAKEKIFAVFTNLLRKAKSMPGGADFRRKSLMRHQNCPFSMNYYYDVRQWVQNQNLRRIYSRLPKVLNEKNLAKKKEMINNYISNPAAIPEKREIVRLDLSKLGLTEIPPQIQLFQEIQELHMRDNRIDFIPLELFKLSKLEKLNVGDNRLSTIPAEVENLKEKLNQLYLDINQIRALPPEIGKLVNLAILNVAQNPLTALPNTTNQLSNLSYVALDCTRVSQDAVKQLQDICVVSDFNVKSAKTREKPRL